MTGFDEMQEQMTKLSRVQEDRVGGGATFNDKQIYDSSAEIEDWFGIVCRTILSQSVSNECNAYMNRMDSTNSTAHSHSGGNIGPHLLLPFNVLFKRSLFSFSMMISTAFFRK